VYPILSGPLDSEEIWSRAYQQRKIGAANLQPSSGKFPFEDKLLQAIDYLVCHAQACNTANPSEGKTA
jgi:hypothetical protein